MKNKFKIGDKAYVIRVCNNLKVMTQEVLIYDIDIREYYDWVSAIGLEHRIINEYINNDFDLIKDKYFYDMDNRVAPFLTTNTKSEWLYSKEELDDAVVKAVEVKRKSIQDIIERAEKFKCPITGGRMFRVIDKLYIMDGPSEYKVEGHDIIWEVWPRDYEPRPYHTTYQGKKYVFERVGDTWKELTLIQGDSGGMYVDKSLYDAGDFGILEKIENFSENQRVEKEGIENRMLDAISSGTLLPLAIKVSPRLVANELVEVRPMSCPIGLPFYKQDDKKYKLDIDGFEVEISDYIFDALNLDFIDGLSIFGNSKIIIL